MCCCHTCMAACMAYTLCKELQAVVKAACSFYLTVISDAGLCLNCFQESLLHIHGFG
jgi:hypothetical protein